jgi:hypothetical protein
MSRLGADELAWLERAGAGRTCSRCSRQTARRCASASSSSGCCSSRWR